MPVRVVALAEDAPVLLGGKRRVVVEMRSRKFNLARQINHKMKEFVTDCWQLAEASFSRLTNYG
jgi:hypothetical protein